MKLIKLSAFILTLLLQSCGITPSNKSKPEPSQPPTPTSSPKGREDSEAKLKIANFGEEDSQRFYNVASRTCATALSEIPDDPTATKPIDENALAGKLRKKGLVGFMHAASARLGYFVFTYRDPDDFFRHAEFSLAPANNDIAKKMASLKRHDKILVKGKYIPNGSPVKHISITQLKMIQAYEGATAHQNYEYRTDVTKELSGSNVLYGKIHSVTPGGEFAVLEYKDTVIPMFVRKKHHRLFKGLFRNDKVRIEYEIMPVPKHPLHLRTLGSSEKPIDVIDSMVNCHAKLATLEGQLVRFPKSPQINFPIFALKFIDPNGIERNWTLVGKGMDMFMKVNKKLDKQWRTLSRHKRMSRNAEVNPKILVIARGTMNVVSPNQANPQLLLQNLEDVQILKK